jgi:hypothetical protein
MKKPDEGLAEEAKAIVALAFRNDPVEDVHAGKVCPVCNGSAEYSRITDDEMKAMMKLAVNAVYKLLCNRDYDSEAYRKSIQHGVRFHVPLGRPGIKRGACPLWTGSSPKLGNALLCWFDREVGLLVYHCFLFGRELLLYLESNGVDVYLVCLGCGEENLASISLLTS